MAEGKAQSFAFVVAADAQVHAERIELWPAAVQAANAGTTLALLSPQSEQSYLVDAKGERINYTPNTGWFRIGGEMVFRLERITAKTPLRIRVQDPDLFGEVLFRADPGQDAHVTLRLTTWGKIAFNFPVEWTDGTIEVDVHDGERWQLVDHWQHQQQAHNAGDSDFGRAPGKLCSNAPAQPRSTPELSRWSRYEWLARDACAHYRTTMH